MNHRKALELALEAFKSGDLRDIDAATDAINDALVKPSWVYLTNEEHEQLAIDCGCLSADWVFYGAAVERKVKEKNHETK